MPALGGTGAGAGAVGSECHGEGGVHAWACGRAPPETAGPGILRICIRPSSCFQRSQARGEESKQQNLMTLI